MASAFTVDVFNDRIVISLLKVKKLFLFYAYRTGLNLCFI